MPRPVIEIGPFSIRTALVCHPGPTVGYRIEADDAVIAYLPDHEPYLGLRTDVWHESEWLSGYDVAARADLLIHDAQYTDEEYDRCVGWGHSSYRHALAFAANVGAKRLVPFHHDPSHDDATLDNLLADAKGQFNPTCPVIAGYEGCVFEVERDEI